jgi:threonine dehydrogenase-like Zn-dependent dehydrogenase
MENKMKAAYLPGNSTTVIKEVDIPVPGHGQVLIRTKSSTICGSDIRAIYHEHLGKGAEGYQNKIAGHEPCGQVVACGPGLKRFKMGDRVIVYHISGCGVCNDCRRGYMISCTSEYRAAYGWQRDGGMAPYILADEKDLVLLPDSSPIPMAHRLPVVSEPFTKDSTGSASQETMPCWWQDSDPLDSPP